MTIGGIIDEVKMRLKYAAASVGTDELTLLIVLNMAMRKLFPLILQNDPSHYTKSVTFGATTSFAKPADFWADVAITVPAATMGGGARFVPHEAVEEINKNPYLKSRTTSPTYTVERTAIVFPTSTAGTLYYIWFFREFTDSDLTYELNDYGDPANPSIIPWIWLEPLIRLMVVIARERYMKMMPLSPSDQTAYELAMQQAQDALERSLAPIVAFMEEAQTPPQLQ